MDSFRVVKQIRCVVKRYFFGVVCYKNFQHTLGTMMATNVIPIIAMYQQLNAAKPYVPATTYGRPTLGDQSSALHSIYLTPRYIRLG